MEYDGDLHIPKQFLVEPPSLTRTVGEYLARNGVRQLAIAETQKFGHVTYFWNGNRSGKFDEQQETYICVDSDIRPFAERPWMKSAEVADALIDEVGKGGYRHVRVNFANGDMVGHTGKLQSAIQAVEAVDLAVGRLMTLTEQLKGVLLVTADHGNADEMFELDKKTGQIKRNEDGTPKPKTSHTLNPVPLYLYAPATPGAYRLTSVDKRGLSNLAATLLNLLGYEAPDDYDPSLIEPA
jgi:2,3-bisphosphoglycerate-independent phosphoglycerate mutase